MIAIVRALAGVLAALVLGWVAPAPVDATATALVVACSFDASGYDHPTDCSTPKRGSSAARVHVDDSAARPAVDRGWHSGVARPGAAANEFAYSYVPANLAQGASGSEAAHGAGGDLSPLRSAGVAAKGAAAFDDHIVLGLEKAGLRETASKVGGQHLMDDPYFRENFLEAAKNPRVKFTVSLDGLSGSGARSQVTRTIEDGMANGYGNSFMNWELAMLSRYGRLGDVTFVRGGSVVPNPFG